MVPSWIILWQRNGLKKATLPSTDDSTWYLPYHGVYHPFKPGKTRVVFDWSAEFHGTSLDEEILPGPDLTSQLVGVLTRFRTKKWHSWMILKLCFTKCTSLKRKESFFGTCWTKEKKLFVSI